MTYRVRVAPSLTVIDANGVPVTSALVLEIIFPVDAIDTPTGKINIIAGQGVAKIKVGGETIRGVPLC